MGLRILAGMPRPPLPVYDTFMKTKKFGALDGLRAVSVVAVIWHHTSGLPGPPISRAGYLGVDLFFAISGFLITTLLLREQRDTQQISLRNFYARRSLRIFPLYYAVLFIYVLVILAMERGTTKGNQFFGNLPAFLTYTVNWFVDLTAGQSVPFYFAWSLSAEEQFYLLWPPVLVLTLALSKAKPWGPLIALSILTAVSVISRVLTDPSQMPWRIAASVPLPILLGASFAVVLHSPRGFLVATRVLGRIWSAPVALGALGVALWFDYPQWVAQVVMAVLVSCVTASEKTVLHPILQWRPLVFVGVISYGIYLLHMLCANAVRLVVNQDMGVTVFFGTTVLAILVATFSFKFFETPVLKFKRRFETPSERLGDEVTRIKGQDGDPAHPK